MQRLNLLTRVIARSSQKARFRRVCAFCLLLGLNKGALHALSLCNIRKRDYDPLDPAILSTVGQHTAIVPTTVPTLYLSLDRSERFQHGSSIQQQGLVRVEQLVARDRLTDVLRAETK